MVTQRGVSCLIRRSNVRKEPEDFDGRDLSLIHVAKKLKHALRLEHLLTEAGLDYLVQPEEYSAGMIFRTKRVGAFFYVLSHDDAAAREVLRRGGLTPFEQ